MTNLMTELHHEINSSMTVPVTAASEDNYNYRTATAKTQVICLIWPISVPYYSTNLRCCRYCSTGPFARHPSCPQAWAPDSPWMPLASTLPVKQAHMLACGASDLTDLTPPVSRPI